jgi:hypothetical protein
MDVRSGAGAVTGLRFGNCVGDGDCTSCSGFIWGVQGVGFHSLMYPTASW